MSRAVEFLSYRRRAFQIELGHGMKNMKHWRIRLLRRFSVFRRWAYRAVFPNQAAMSIVLQDMCVFCRVFETCVIPGDRDRSLILEGRREYALRVMEHLNLSVEQLYRLYGGLTPPAAKRTDNDD
jgi:hypothetical protein